MGEDLYTIEEDLRSTWMLLSIGFQLRNLVLIGVNYLWIVASAPRWIYGKRLMSLLEE